MIQKHNSNIEYLKKVFVMLLTAGILLFLLTGCTVKFVPVYDDKLYNDTEAFFKKAGAMIELGKTVSPKTDDERALITKPDKHPGHISAFEPKYNELLLDADALILRAIVNGQEVGLIGAEAQKKINQLIDESSPSTCKDLEETQEARASLTAMNYVDMKCMVIKWKDQHGNQEITKGKSILKRGNWEGRKQALFGAILAIQKAEGFKKK